MRIAVIIPTYNERENISSLIEALQTEFKRNPGHSFDIVFVDGNSPDGTAEVIRSFGIPEIHLIVEEEKTGLGSAYILGMRYALANLSPDALVEMDADFQHDPKDLGRFIGKLEEGFDYVVGSRYIKGGSIPNEWAIHRKFLSYFGNFFARVVLGLFHVHDITSGYRISRATKISEVDLSALDRRVYAYKIQLLYEMFKRNAKITEIPIKFGLRDKGYSKMQVGNIFGSFSLVAKVRIKENASFFKFLVVGLCGLSVQTVLLFILSLSGFMVPSRALLPSFLAAVFTTFTLNNLWSFRDRAITGFQKKVAKFATFLLVNIGSYFIQKGFIVLAELLFDRTLTVLLTGYPAGILVGLVWNYLFYSKIIWQKNA